MASNLSANYLRVNIAVSSLATVLYILRLLARWQHGIRYGLDDLLITIAWIFLLGLNITSGILYTASGSDGTPTADLSMERQLTLFKTFYAVQILYYFCMLPTKLSILALYNRIFTPRNFRIAIYCTAAICISWGIGGLFPTILQCKPIEYSWNRVTITGTCLDTGMLFTAITISNLLTDVLVLVLPIFMVYQLQLSLKQKILVSSIFLAGSTACICALIRVLSASKFSNDPLSLVIDCALWITLEPALAIISACLPCLKPLLAPKKMSRWYSSFGSASQASTAVSHKSRGSWFGLDQARSGKIPRHGTITTVSGLESHDDALPLKGTDPYRMYEDSKPNHSTHILAGIKQSHSHRNHDSRPIPLNGIHVRSDFTVDAESLTD